MVVGLPSPKLYFSKLDKQYPSRFLKTFNIMNPITFSFFTSFFFPPKNEEHETDAEIFFVSGDS